MKDNDLLMIVLAFVVGYMCSGMMKSMCGKLIEGLEEKPESCGNFSKEDYDICEKNNWKPGKSLNRGGLETNETCKSLQSALGDTGSNCRKWMCSGPEDDLSKCGPFKDGYWINHYGNAKQCRPGGGKVPASFMPKEVLKTEESQWFNSCVKPGNYVDPSKDVVPCDHKIPAGLSEQLWTDYLRSCVNTSSGAWGQVCDPPAPGSYWDKNCPKTKPA